MKFSGDMKYLFALMDDETRYWIAQEVADTKFKHDAQALFHNFIRTHEGLGGKTPAEACGIKVEGDNKWITLIQNASFKEYQK